ncbi:MAG: S8 family peptidase [Sphingomonadaceae bacterium]
MTMRPVLIELEHSPALESAAAGLEAAVEAPAGLILDPGFAPVPVPALVGHSPLEAGFESAAQVSVDDRPEASTYVVRGMMEVGDSEAEAAAAAAAVSADPRVRGVFADVEIEPQLICPGSPPMGTHLDVERLLCVPALRRAGMDGSGVTVAIVDSGINSAHLIAQGKPHTLDVARSWVPVAGQTPGAAPVGHGTMCAFDVLIAAPKATLLDIALLRSPQANSAQFTTFLISDALRAYNHLRSLMAAPARPGVNRSLVVNNSWGQFHSSWDFPVGNPGNYSHNPNHPFNKIVAALEADGADILFAAGNCGSDCPDSRCQGVTANTIVGANSHPAVLSVGGVDTSKTRVGYSAKGPGALSRNKPDLCGYTHFDGSKVYAADGGTSAATPVVAGVIACIRQKRPFVPANPAASPAGIRDLVRSTCQDLGTAGYDFDHGFGVINGCAIVDRLQPRFDGPVIDLCRRFPDLCRPRPWELDLCRRFPWICRGEWRDPRIPIPGPRPGPIPGPIGPGPRPGLMAEGGEADAAGADMAVAPGDLAEMLATAYEAGRHDALAEAGSPRPASPGGGCGCHKG